MWIYLWSLLLMWFYRNTILYIYPVCNDEENLYWHTCWTVSIHILPQSQTCSLLIHQLCAFLWSFSLVDFCAASYSIGPIGIGFLAVNGSHSPPFSVYRALVSWTHQNNLNPKRDSSLEFPCNRRLSQELRKFLLQWNLNLKYVSHLKLTGKSAAFGCILPMVENLATWTAWK